MLLFWRWLISPVQSWRQWQGKRRAAREQAHLQQQQRLNDAAQATMDEATQAARVALETERIRLIEETPPGYTCHHSFGNDRTGTPLLLFARLGASRVDVLAVTAYGNCSHHEMALLAIIDGEIASLENIRSVNHSRGVGTAVLRFAEPLMQELGARLVRATLRYDNQKHLVRQRHFFAKNGYRLVPDSMEPMVEKRLF